MRKSTEQYHLQKPWLNRMLHLALSIVSAETDHLALSIVSAETDLRTAQQLRVCRQLQRTYSLQSRAKFCLLTGIVLQLCSEQTLELVAFQMLAQVDKQFYKQLRVIVQNTSHRRTLYHDEVLPEFRQWLLPTSNFWVNAYRRYTAQNLADKAQLDLAEKHQSKEA